ncbi:hydroxylysine kinase-like [Glandiceps talaboti]
MTLTPTHDMHYAAGCYLGNVDTVLQSFCHDGLINDTPGGAWSMKHVSSLRLYYDAIKDQERKDLIEFYIQEFEKEVLPKIDQLKGGIIHGDFHDENIITTPLETVTSMLGDLDKRPIFGTERQYQISGLIDFGDVQSSYYAFGVAISIANFMMESEDPFPVGGNFLAGYQSNFTLSELERAILPTCVSARLCQEMVLARHQLTINSSDRRLVGYERKAWTLLDKMRHMRMHEISAKWNDIIASYKTEVGNG